MPHEIFFCGEGGPCREWECPPEEFVPGALEDHPPRRMSARNWASGQSRAAYAACVARAVFSEEIVADFS